jgi:hypothetical protein
MQIRDGKPLLEWLSHRPMGSSQGKSQQPATVVETPASPLDKESGALTAAEQRCLDDWLKTLEDQKCAPTAVDSNPDWLVD